MEQEPAGQCRPAEVAGAETGDDGADGAARGARFAAEAERLAELTGAAPGSVRERLLKAVEGMASLSTHPLSDLDYHRILDAVVLITREMSRMKDW